MRRNCLGIVEGRCLVVGGDEARCESELRIARPSLFQDGRCCPLVQRGEYYRHVERYWYWVWTRLRRR